MVEITDIPKIPNIEMGVLLTLQKRRKNYSDPKVTQKWLRQTDPKVT